MAGAGPSPTNAAAATLAAVSPSLERMHADVLAAIAELETLDRVLSQQQQPVPHGTNAALQATM
jgi:hypothetical protein